MQAQALYVAIGIANTCKGLQNQLLLTGTRGHFPHDTPVVGGRAVAGQLKQLIRCGWARPQPQLQAYPPGPQQTGVWFHPQRL
jgi:hypothetical protein